MESGYLAQNVENWNCSLLLIFTMMDTYRVMIMIITITITFISLSMLRVNLIVGDI